LLRCSAPRNDGYPFSASLPFNWTLPHPILYDIHHVKMTGSFGRPSVEIDTTPARSLLIRAIAVLAALAATGTCHQYLLPSLPQMASLKVSKRDARRCLPLDSLRPARGRTDLGSLRPALAVAGFGVRRQHRLSRH
jgi:hypothetical protein